MWCCKKWDTQAHGRAHGVHTQTAWSNYFHIIQTTYRCVVGTHYTLQKNLLARLPAAPGWVRLKSRFCAVTTSQKWRLMGAASTMRSQKQWQQLRSLQNIESCTPTGRGSLTAIFGLNRIPPMTHLIFCLTHRLWNRRIGAILCKHYQRGTINSEQLHTLCASFDPSQKHEVYRK